MSEHHDQAHCIKCDTWYTVAQTKCPNCGYVPERHRALEGSNMLVQPGLCPRCDGRGSYRGNNQCEMCSGTGYLAPVVDSAE
jgi:DnaJ-class molecular chaperone